MKLRLTGPRKNHVAPLAVPAALLLVYGGSFGAPPANTPPAGAPGIQDTARLAAGGMLPPGTPLRNPYAGVASVAKAGASLFTSMNCDGCHGGDAAGWVGPNLGDGRWRYGGSDTDVFRSIFYGRPKGMPAFGGVVGTDGVWVLITYLRSLPPPADEPTESWPQR